jgi:winged helix DNA-binding protein
VSEATLRARGQWLHVPGGDVLRHLLAVQAQDLRTPSLALQVRGGALDDGMRITWLMRSTLHLVHADDLTWLHPLFAPRMQATSRRRLAQLGVTEAQAERAVSLIAEFVPARRAELAEHLASHDIPVAGQAIVHLLARAAMQGRVVLTPDRVFIPLSLPPAGDREAALDELARRYYAAHAAATADDLAYWSGLPKRDCRPPGPSAIEDGPVPRVLLPAFDELLLGWRDRTPTVPPQHAKAIHPGGGILRPVILENGVAVGTWSIAGGEAPF